ncbi:hypothetical protein ACNJ7E_19190 [Rhodococcus sp. NM-2]|uniref:hypothetical protein n=1 Tax=Rhodococcus sp. NM-2 TaxID=3401174 RepID=UPI003AAE45EB
MNQETGKDDNTVDTPSNSRGAPDRLARIIGSSRGAGNSTISVKTLVVSALILAIVAALGVSSWLLHNKSNELDQMNLRAENGTHAEQVALDYAVGAADMSFQDIQAWRSRLTNGTGPELSNKLTQAASSMEQIITPLQWVSTSTPIAAKVRSESNGIYVVDCFVSVLTKNSQAPEGIQSTATYSLNIDSRNDWVITDVGGIESALSEK